MYSRNVKSQPASSPIVTSQKSLDASILISNKKFRMTATPPPAAALTSRQRTAATQTQTQIQQSRQPVLHLRGAVRTAGERLSSDGERRIQWAEGVVDNEGLGRKSSKGELVLITSAALLCLGFLMDYCTWREDANSKP